MRTIAKRLGFAFLAMTMVVAALFVAASSSNANAWGVHVAAAVTTSGGASTSGGGGVAGAGAACAAGCAAVAGGIGMVFGLIVGDKVNRVIAGPACATGKMRRSWFGMVRDDPELWLPKCKRQHRQHRHLDPNTVRTRG